MSALVLQVFATQAYRITLAFSMCLLQCLHCTYELVEAHIVRSRALCLQVLYCLASQIKAFVLLSQEFYVKLAISKQLQCVYLLSASTSTGLISWACTFKL